MTNTRLTLGGLAIAAIAVIGTVTLGPQLGLLKKKCPDKIYNPKPGDDVSIFSVDAIGAKPFAIPGYHVDSIWLNNVDKTTYSTTTQVYLSEKTMAGGGGDCNLPATYDTNAYYFDYNYITFNFEIYDRATDVLQCLVPMQIAPNWTTVFVETKFLTFDVGTPPTMPLPVTVTVSNTGLGTAAKLDIVRNRYKYPDLMHATYILKIIGADDGRDINNPSPPSGQMAVANVQMSKLWINRNSSASTYTLKQATGSTPLAENFHTSTQVISERNDKQSH